MRDKELVLRLIKDNLINTRLVLGLSRMDLCASNYYLALPDTILLIMNLQIPDEDLGIYFEIFNEVDGIDLGTEPEKLNQLSLKIYYKLINWNK